jgi:hypothetical protein
MNMKNMQVLPKSKARTRKGNSNGQFFSFWPSNSKKLGRWSGIQGAMISPKSLESRVSFTRSCLPQQFSWPNHGIFSAVQFIFLTPLLVESPCRFLKQTLHSKVSPDVCCWCGGCRLWRHVTEKVDHGARISMLQALLRKQIENSEKTLDFDHKFPERLWFAQPFKHGLKELQKRLFYAREILTRLLRPSQVFKVATCKFGDEHLNSNMRIWPSGRLIRYKDKGPWFFEPRWWAHWPTLVMKTTFFFFFWE